MAYRDSFNGVAASLLTARTPESTGAYAVHPGKVGSQAVITADGAVRSNGAVTDAWIIAPGTVANPSYDVCFTERIRTTITSPGNYVGVILDVSLTLQTGYICYYHSTGVWTVTKISNGTSTGLTAVAGIVAVAYANGTDLSVRWQLDRQTTGSVFLRLFINGVFQALFRDTSSILTSTKRIALRFVNTCTDSTGHHFGDIAMESVGAPSMVADVATVVPSSTGNVITLTGTNTFWDCVAPVFTVNGATKTAQSIISATSATVTITAPSTAGPIVITNTITGISAKLSSVPASIEWLNGNRDWKRRRQFTINAPSGWTERDYQHTITLYRSAGTDTANALYMGHGIRSDWSDLRITDASGQNQVPYEILVSSASEATIVLTLSRLAVGDNNLAFYWKRIAPAGSIYKIAHITDVHYDTLTTYCDRDQTIVYMNNFKNRMATYLPDLLISAGDKTGATSSVEATQLGWYQAVMDKFQECAPYATTILDGVAPGNHDFEYMQESSIKTKHVAETWMETGKLYGKLETPDYLFISLDSNYAPGTETHMNLNHQGFGCINQAQLTWLAATLASATKPCIVTIHHALTEIDTAQINLNKDLYHCSNREAVRAILEASGKVACVFSGHQHWTRPEIINGIAYLVCNNISNDPDRDAQEGAMKGKWCFIEIDKDSGTIYFKKEGQDASGNIIQLLQYVIPFKTIYSSTTAANRGNDPELVHAFGNTAQFGRSSFCYSPSQFVINNKAYIKTSPVYLNAGQTRLSDRTIRIYGLDDDPNYGRMYWPIAPQYAGTFELRFSVRMLNFATKFFKIEGADNAAAAAYLAFYADGNIKAYNTSSTLTVIQAYVLSTWYHFRVIVNMSTGKWSVYMNNVLIINDFFFHSANSYVSQMEVVTETGDCHFEPPRLHRYVATEPSLNTWSVFEGGLTRNPVSIN